jgi:GAF domain-containing protein
MKGLHLVSERQTNHTSWGGHPKGLVYPDLINTEPGVMENMIGGSNNFRMINLDGSIDFGSELPEVITTTPIKSGCKSLVLIPGRNNGKIELLILLGLQDDQQFTSERLDLYYSLASMAVSILSKFNTQQRLEKRVAALQSLNTVSQAVSVETDLNILYQLIHREVSSIVGKVNFAIATYDAQQDSITVPYMYDGQSTRSVEAFPMGEGLTSILIRTKRSLLLVDDTERKTKELGAKLVGKPAKSWLGVPLLVGGEVIGAILLQDLEQEGRFDKDDQLLMETLATQVAVAIRNARVLETLHKQASRQQQLYEITSKIRSSPNISGILETTASELTKVLGARRTSIELGLSPTKQNGLVSTDSTGA